MAQSHTAQPETLLDSHAILEKYYRAIRTPLLHLAQQFVNPGISDKPAEDKEQKQVAQGEDANADLQTSAPALTRNAAFSKLKARLVVGITEQDQNDFIPWINDLEKRKESLNPFRNEKR